jgi:hypothetical protein
VDQYGYYYDGKEVLDKVIEKMQRQETGNKTIALIKGKMYEVIFDERVEKYGMLQVIHYAL